MKSDATQFQVHGGRKSLRIIDTIKYMIREGGVFGLWRGNGINVIKIAPESAIKFASYDFLKRVIRGDEDRELLLYERFLAGSLAGGVSQSVIYPLEVRSKFVIAYRFPGFAKSILETYNQV